MTTPLADLARAAFSDLTAGESRIVEGAAAGEDVEFADQASIRPAVVRWLCVNAAARALVEPRGIRVTNARLTGDLDLRNISIDFYLRFINCQIDGDINLNDARVRTLGFNGSTCRSFLAWRAQISGELFLTNSSADDATGQQSFRSDKVGLGDSIISGNVNLEDSWIGPVPDADEGAVIAHRAQIRGILFANRAHIKGSFVIWDGVLGGIHATSARIATLPSAPDRPAVEIIRTTVRGDLALYADDGVSTGITGSVNLYGSVVGGNLRLVGAQFGPVEPGDVSALTSPAPGTSAGENTSSPPELDADPGDPFEPLPDLLTVVLTRVGGHLDLTSTILRDGSLTIQDSEIGQDLTLGQFHNSAGPSTARPAYIRVTSTTVSKVFRWNVLPTEDAAVDLSGSTVDRLVHPGVSYWPSKGRLWVDGLRYRLIDGPMVYKRQWISAPSFRIRKRHPGRPAWPWRMLLKATDALAGADATQLRWLRLHTQRSYDPQPYDTLAAALRARGRDAEATRVMIARTDDRRRSSGPLAVLLGLPYKLFVGNGFRTWWAALWIVLLTVIGTMVFGAAYDHTHLVAVKAAKETLPFNPFVYSLDVLLPIVDFGQAGSYLPSATGADAVRVFYWVDIALGWLLAIALSASAAAILQRRGSAA